MTSPAHDVPNMMQFGDKTHRLQNKDESRQEAVGFNCLPTDYWLTEKAVSQYVSVLREWKSVHHLTTVSRPSGTARSLETGLSALACHTNDNSSTANSKKRV
ncbi:unnamed protein product [Leuciscus chuanchicus]